MNKILLVGGTWDNDGGKPSKIIKSVYDALKPLANTVLYYNGGYYNALRYTIELVKFVNAQSDPIDAVLWFPNVPNGLGKGVDVKNNLPKTMLVTSKNNYDKSYTFQELVAHAISLKSNLFLEITKENNRYCGQIFDPLGNVWSEKTADFNKLSHIMIERCEWLKKVTRKPTIWSPEIPDAMPLTNENERFFEIVQSSADRFHELIHPAKRVGRFLGNASFRCGNGFPSLKSSDGRIYVSRRNVDKRALSANEFVQVGYNPDKDITWYRGDNKPSVDTVIQVQLYHKLPHIRYMIHSHVYAEYKRYTTAETVRSYAIKRVRKDIQFTENMIPCGGLEEVDEILKIIEKHKIDTNFPFAVNLVGHGSLVCVQKPEDFELFEYRPRPMPEILHTTSN